MAETVSRRQEVELLEAAILVLPARCRAILILRRFENLSHHEIVQELGIAEHTMEAQLTKVLHRYEDYFTRHGASRTRSSMSVFHQFRPDSDEAIRRQAALERYNGAWAVLGRIPQHVGQPLVAELGTSRRWTSRSLAASNSTIFRRSSSTARTLSLWAAASPQAITLKAWRGKS